MLVLAYQTVLRHVPENTVIFLLQFIRDVISRDGACVFLDVTSRGLVESFTNVSEEPAASNYRVPSHVSRG
jgi:hypothetical protein